MRQIPPEYLAFRKEDDFGFSAIDESEVNRVIDPNTLEETVIVRETIAQSSESLSRVEEKLDAMLTLYNQGKLGLDAERQNIFSTLAVGYDKLPVVLTAIRTILQKKITESEIAEDALDASMSAVQNESFRTTWESAKSQKLQASHNYREASNALARLIPLAQEAVKRSDIGSAALGGKSTDTKTEKTRIPLGDLSVTPE
jgi:hypothetical protein